MCNQSGGLIARVLEEHGIPSVVVNQGLQQPMRVKPPRSLYVKHPYGQPFGQPDNVDQQRTIVEDALSTARDRHRTGNNRPFPVPMASGGFCCDPQGAGRSEVTRRGPVSRTG